MTRPPTNCPITQPDHIWTAPRGGSRTGPSGRRGVASGESPGAGTRSACPRRVGADDDSRGAKRSRCEGTKPRDSCDLCAGTKPYLSLARGGSCRGGGGLGHLLLREYSRLFRLSRLPARLYPCVRSRSQRSEEHTSELQSPT